VVTIWNLVHSFGVGNSHAWIFYFWRALRLSFWIWELGDWYTLYPYVVITLNCHPCGCVRPLILGRLGGIVRPYYVSSVIVSFIQCDYQCGDYQTFDALIWHGELTGLTLLLLTSSETILFGFGSLGIGIHCTRI